MNAAELFDLPESLPFADFFQPQMAPWEWVSQIKAALASVRWLHLEQNSAIPDGVHIDGKVYIHPRVKLPPYAYIQGPTWIGADTEVRPGAYIRGNVIIGAGCVIGNSTEIKNSLLLDGVQAPHYNYIGDSVLGNQAHLGAGVICANLRLDQKNVPVQLPEGRTDSGMRKLGALMGDGAEAGCNAVLQPGAILGKRAVVMSGLPFSGTLEADTIAHVRHEIRRIKR